MNLYQKLQQARVELHKVDMSKTGENTFSKYKYFELADFLPHITRIFAEMNLFSAISFDAEEAVLTIINSEKPEEVVTFTSPMSTAALKGCHDVQNLGAVQTYLRRYLYINAMDIVESDPLDETHDKSATQAQKGTKQPPKSKSGTTGTPAKEPAKKALESDLRTDMIDSIVSTYREQGKDITSITAFYKVPILEDLTDQQLEKVYNKVVGR